MLVHLLIAGSQLMAERAIWWRRTLGPSLGLKNLRWACVSRMVGWCDMVWDEGRQDVQDSRCAKLKTHQTATVSVIPYFTTMPPIW